LENNGSRLPGPPVAAETYPSDSYVLAQGLLVSTAPPMVRANGTGFASFRWSESDPTTMLTRVIFAEISQQSNAP
jgi:hypothetical protein